MRMALFRAFHEMFHDYTDEVQGRDLSYIAEALGIPLGDLERAAYSRSFDQFISAFVHPAPVHHVDARQAFEQWCKDRDLIRASLRDAFEAGFAAAPAPQTRATGNET